MAKEAILYQQYAGWPRHIDTPYYNNTITTTESLFFDIFMTAKSGLGLVIDN